ncbi:MAG: hypothetical protein ACYTKD_30290 [Planctomycetota bacterium]
MPDSPGEPSAFPAADPVAAAVAVPFALALLALWRRVQLPPAAPADDGHPYFLRFLCA